MIRTLLTVRRYFPYSYLSWREAAILKLYEKYGVGEKLAKAKESRQRLIDSGAIAVVRRSI